MKVLMMYLTIFSCALTGFGEVFRMDQKGDATVEVKKSANEYRVICRFKPQTKFDKAKNARFNDAKGDSLCKKGLARFLNVAADETLAVSGLYSVAPVEKTGDRLSYFFGVPVSGCMVVKAGIRRKPSVETVGSAVVASVTPSVAPALETREEVAPKVPARPKTVKSSAYVCVSRYREVNGKRTTISHKEYQGQNFKSPKDFDQFCQQEFARIRALGEANLRAVRNFGK